MGAWQKTMKPQNLGNSPTPRPKIVQKKEIAKERAIRRACRRTVQNENRGVLNGMTTGAAQRTLNSTNFRKRRIQQKALSVAATMREDKQVLRGCITSSVYTEGTCLSNNFDETNILSAREKSG